MQNVTVARIGSILLVVAGAAALAVSVAMPARAATHEVEIADFAFVPTELTITAGDTVTWTNSDPVVHTATSINGAFDSGDLAQGESYSLTFTAPGTYDYLCTPHPTMTGRIVVVAAAAPSAAASAAPSASGGLPNVSMATGAERGPLARAGLALVGLGLAIAGGRVLARATRQRMPVS